MKSRQPTRWLNTNTTNADTRMIRTSGNTHVGRCTIDSNVGLGLKRTPKIRPIELSGFAASGDGITGVVILYLRNLKTIQCRFIDHYVCVQRFITAARVYRDSWDSEPLALE